MPLSREYASAAKTASRAISDTIGPASVSRPAVSVIQPTASASRFTGNTHDVIQGIGPIDWLKEQYHDYKRLSALVDLMSEAVTTLNAPNVNIINHDQESDTQLPAVPGGQYTVRVNRDEPVTGFGADDHRLTSIILHELTHVAADQGYGGSNAGRPMGERPANMSNIAGVPDSAATRLARAEAQDLIEQQDDIFTTFQNDTLIPDTERVYIESRIGRMANYATEFDTVVNELLLYFHLKGIPARSETSKKLTAKARARQELRRM